MMFLNDYLVPGLKFVLPAVLFLFVFKRYLTPFFDKDEEFR